MNEDVFPGNSEMAQRMRALDWSATPLGPVERWPAALRTTVSTCLNCAFPIVLWWGPELATLYNDEYRPMLGPAKHPAALGERGFKVWAEIWDIIGPMLSQVLERGEATRSRDLMLLIDRGYLEETYFSFSYSPIHIDAGRVGGVFCPVIETTDKIIGERRLRTLRDLAARCKGLANEESVYEAAAEILAANPHDIPFALFYRIDASRSSADLAAAAGIASGTPASPRHVSTEPGSPDPWSLQHVAHSGKVALLGGLRERFEELPSGPWKVAPERALALPVLLPGQELPRAVLVAAASPVRALDDGYRTFFGLIATQIASALADVRALDEERRRTEALAELDRVKTAFFSNVSHEFRTPLTLLIGPLEDILSRADGTLPRDVEAAVGVAHRNGLRLLKLVNTLLDFSRIEAGRIDANYEPTDLATLTTDLSAVFRSAIEKAGLTFEVRCDPIREPAFVDRDMWEKIVLNLLSNAFKFTIEGRIDVRLHSSDGFVELTVSDTGVGIPRSALPGIFERFHRVKNTRARTHEGTGIGLALVRELVRLHGGDVLVESEEGRGTIFTVRIPVGRAHLPADRITVGRPLTATTIGALPYVEEALRWLPQEEPAAALRPVAPRNSRERTPGSDETVPRVLVADDNADMRDYLARVLGHRYRVEAVGDGLAALQTVETSPPDIIVADVMMPGLDGFGLLTRLRADDRSRPIPVILLSARAGEDARIEGLEAGANEYLAKPFSARELLACIASQLQLARLRAESGLALRFRSEQHETLLNRIPLGVYLVDADLRIREVNPAALPYFGDIPGGLIGRDLSEIVHGLWRKDHADELVRIFRHTLETGEPYATKGHSELRLDRGSAEDYEWRLFRITLPDGHAGLVCYFRDVTKDKQAFAAQAYLAAIVNSADDAIIAKNLDGVIQSCNAAAERLFGYSSEELVGRPVRILIPPERQLEEDDILAKLRRGERVEHFETIRVAKDGRRLELSLTISPVRDESGAIVGASKIGRDITALRQAEAERMRLLQEQVLVTDTLNRVGAIVASALDRGKVVQAVTDAATELTTAEFGAFFYNLVNEAGESYSLYTISGVPRDAFSSFPMPRNTDVFAPTFAGSGVVRSADITQDSRYGRNAPHHGMPPGHLPVRSYLAVPVKGPAGDVIGGLFFGHSSPGRFAEQHERLALGIASWASVALENARLYASVQDASRIKDEFLASLSHELRTPLNAILGYARMLRAGIVAPDKKDKAIDTIERNASSLTQIVEDVLDISRIVSGKIRLNVQSVEFPEIVRSAVDAVVPAADAKGVRIETALDPHAAPVSGDPERLQQVLWNLLSNAVKFTNRGGRVHVRLERVDSHVALTVSDTGIGIAREFLPHVFERFRQADAGIARERGGLGLGLSIARQLTEMHGGTIEVSSGGLGQGATFRLKLPLMREHRATDAADQIPPRPPRRPLVTPLVDLRDVHVLAVDDEEDALSLVRAVLEAAGAQVTTAHSTDAALSALEREVPDVLVADLGMPHLDGFHLIERVRRHRVRRVREVPAAALTAYARSEDRMKALRAGFQIHLAKPIDPAELATTVAALARRFAPTNPEDPFEASAS
jgi:PAS domain S-box-containing protein